MIDPAVLTLKAMVEALEESGISDANEELARDIVDALFERGYEITKTAPAVPGQEESE